MKHHPNPFKKTLCLVFFLAMLCSATGALKAEERLLYFEEGTSIPLYKEPNSFSTILGECFNNIVLEVLDSPSAEWAHVKMGSTEEYLEGYVASSALFDVQSPFFNLSNCTHVQSNCEDLTVGTLISSATGEIIGHIPNGDTALVFARLTDGRCFIRHWSLEKRQMIFGYIEETDVIPLDGSIGTYPLDSRVQLDGFTYTFEHLWPEDLERDLSGLEILQQTPIVGGIAANGAAQAFVATQEGTTVHFYELSRTNGRWTIENVLDGLLDQDGYIPGLIGFSCDAKEISIQFSDVPYDRIQTLAFSRDAQTDPWRLTTAVYVFNGNYKASIYCENDEYYMGHSAIGFDPVRYPISMCDEDVLISSTSIRALEELFRQQQICSGS